MTDHFGRQILDCRECAEEDVARAQKEVEENSRVRYCVMRGWSRGSWDTQNEELTPAEYLALQRARLERIKRAEANDGAGNDQP